MQPVDISKASVGALGEMSASNADLQRQGAFQGPAPKRIEREGETEHTLLGVRPTIYLKPALFHKRI